MVRGIQIHVVDDDEPVRRCLTSGFKSLGHRCYAAPTLNEAIQQLPEDGEVIVLIDHSVNDMPLPQFLKFCRNKLQAVRFVGMSGEDRRSEFSAVGIDCFVTKPMGLRDLQAAVDDSEQHHTS